jgi:hypothetical protein
MVVVVMVVGESQDKSCTEFEIDIDNKSKTWRHVDINIVEPTGLFGDTEPTHRFTRASPLGSN